MISMTIDIALLARKIESFDDITEGVRFVSVIPDFKMASQFLSK